MLSRSFLRGSVLSWYHYGAQLTPGLFDAAGTNNARLLFLPSTTISCDFQHKYATFCFCDDQESPAVARRHWSLPLRAGAIFSSMDFCSAP
jgi:hypothetical protein